MIEIRLHDHAKDDIKRLFADKESKWIAGYASFLVKELRTNKDLQDQLLVHDSLVELSENGVASISIQKWISQFNGRPGRDLWRIKPRNNAGNQMPFRMIFAYRMPYGGFDAEIWVLAVLKRSEFNYEDENPYTKRIVSDYEQLD